MLTVGVLLLPAELERGHAQVGGKEAELLILRSVGRTVTGAGGDPLDVLADTQLRVHPPGTVTSFIAR